MTEEKYIALLVNDRIFVKIENGKEITIDVHNLKKGDRFALYHRGLDDRLTWGTVDEFICDGKIYKVKDGTKFIPCMLTQ